ncbi:MAG: ribonuclease HI family protein [Candidatus Moranbacteria bacterium]|nr:ribonuclease HI family protein [Candidatus Moranbacteria bacterium]
MEKIIMYSDGGSRGNPGPAALGVHIETLGKSYGEYLGEKTNNEAEYAAIVFGLKKIKALIGKAKAKQTSVECRMDSELACKQLNHEYKIENEKLQPLFLEVWNLSLDFMAVKFVHVRRELNTVADACANKAMDEAEKKRGLF